MLPIWAQGEKSVDFKPKGKKGEKSLALFPFIRTFALNQKCFTKGVTQKV